MARGLDLDLVEVAPMANPPVCRIMDYGKFRYEEAQKAKESRKKSMNVSVKEVKFKPKIGRGDFDTKVRKIDQFIHEGHKVKVTMQFRGREMAHPELGSKILDEVLVKVGGYAKVETQARLEGRNMSMVLSPDRKALDVKPTVETHPNGDTPVADAPDAGTPDPGPLAADTPVADIPVADTLAADTAVADTAPATADAD
jgi:translation initiation factor IF-3